MFMRKKGEKIKGKEKNNSKKWEDVEGVGEAEAVEDDGEEGGRSTSSHTHTKKYI